MNFSSKKNLILVLLGVILLVMLACSSYFYSKMAAESLIGGSINYLELSDSSIKIMPYQKHTVRWRFIYNLQDATDEIIIYTSLLGNITRTNPLDLESGLRKFEKSMEK